MVLEDSGSPEVELVITVVVRGAMGPQGKSGRVPGMAGGTKAVLMATST